MNEGVRERVKGKYPLSVATSIAMESITGHQDPTNGKPTRNTLVLYEELWINVKTLFRNICGALPPGSGKPPVDDLVVAVINEINAIRDIVQRNSNSKVIFYISNYDRIESIYKNVELRRDNTPKQKDYTQTMSRVLQTVIRKTPKDNDYFLLFNHELKPKTRKNTVILTHIPYDLLSSDNFGALTLLESHTGNIKTKPLWYTKYYQGDSLPPIPFCKYLIAVFGDREMFRPLKIDAKEDVIQLAKKHGWTAITTDAKMKNDLRELKNKYLYETIRSFY